MVFASHEMHSHAQSQDIHLENRQIGYSKLHKLRNECEYHLLSFGCSMHSPDWNPKSKADAIAEFTAE